MITEDYVSFETAKLLKEKGFDERCTHYYKNEKYLVDLGYTNIHSYTNSDLVEEFAAPTLPTAMKWLRRKHNFFIQVTVDFSDGAYPMYDVCVIDLARCTSIIVNGYDRYNFIQAYETAIKYCLENLI